MHKLITLSDAQHENAIEVMKTTRIESFSEFFRFLVFFYEQNQRRTPGRPRSREDDASRSVADELDDVPMYQNPDKNTTSPYSYNDLVAWYSANPSYGPMPDRDGLKAHKDHKKKLV